ncbi:uncharacterized protein LOC119435543 [Dermacentor silvarum]|uniref:uncharacterized protein LOC119434445 n=1 Tax=Dermacentor silvarum TaxID=543639 RepID=UPI0018989474|nr:uncharacterized protein LOC119434445 [Dermacentor silvarum]XP_037558295.1 uncharacterized protein LOC119435543 [Dermacentor silvarum]
MVERLHRQLKTALTTRLNCATWVDALPLVLLGLRAVLRADLQCSAEELVYGSSLSLPGDFFTSTQLSAQPQQFLQRLLDCVKDLRPTPPRPSRCNTIFVYPDLATSTHVFVRRDAVRPPLTPAYDGPFLVLRRTPKTATFLQNGQEETVILDRLKPAYVETATESLAPPPDLALECHSRPSVRFRLPVEAGGPVTPSFGRRVEPG